MMVRHSYYGGPSGISGGLNAAPDVQLFGDPIADASLGWSVGCAGDLNGDGYSELAVGAYKSNNGQSEEGLVHLYYGSATGVAATPDVVPNRTRRTPGSAGPWHRRDLDGDGYSELVVGAPHWTSGQPLEGAVFIYYGGPATISAPQDQRIERNSSGANLGECVITAGDLNGDGISELVMGAPLYGNGGAAFVHEGRTIAVSNSLPTSTTASLPGKPGKHRGHCRRRERRWIHGRLRSGLRPPPPEVCCMCSTGPPPDSRPHPTCPSRVLRSAHPQVRHRRLYRGRCERGWLCGRDRGAPASGPGRRWCSWVRREDWHPHRP